MIPTVGGDRGEGSLYLAATRSPPENDFRIKMGSDLSHVNVLLTVQGQVTRQCHTSQYHEEKGEPKRGVEPASFRLPAERPTTRPSRLT